jgi:hypothetical protein
MNALDSATILYDFDGSFARLAREISNCRNKHRQSLTFEQKGILQTQEIDCQNISAQLANLAGIGIVDHLQAETDALENAIEESHKFLDDVAKVKGLISAVATTIDLANNFISLIKKPLLQRAIV